MNSHPIIINEGSVEQKREKILTHFHKTFDIDQQLYNTLDYNEIYYLHPEPLRHPLNFYFGHTASFFISISLSLPRFLKGASTQDLNQCLQSVWTKCPGMTSMKRTTTDQALMRFGPTVERYVTALQTL